VGDGESEAVKLYLKKSFYGLSPADEQSEKAFLALSFGDVIEVDYHKEKGRTDQQRKAIEVFCSLLADEFNKAGLDKRAVFAKLREGVEIPWDQGGVKNDIWRLIQIAAIGKESTTDLHTDEVSKVYELVNRFTAERLGVHVPFPSRFGV
jgi:hypothetical protein